ncbi:MAG: hypothetical protein WEA09_14775 [Gemmatimonadota bacterium]
MVVLYLAALAVLAILAAALSTAVYRVPRRWACPKCHVATVPLKKRVGWLVSRWVEWRWCPRCHWQGLSRGNVGKAPPPPSGRDIPPRDSFRWRGRRSPSPDAPGDIPTPTLQADHSAFQWGTERSPPPFQWKGDAAGQATVAPDEDRHPEGDRSSEAKAARPTVRASRPASPGDNDEQEAAEDSDPFGFRWKE